MKNQDIKAFREHNNARLPFWYDWRLHVLTNISMILFAILFSLVFLHKFSILFFLASLFSWGVIEYCIHRFLLHGKKEDLKLRIEHSVYHHNYYTDESMNAEEEIDLNRVFLMPQDLLAVLFAAFILSLFFLFISESVAAVFFLAGIVHIMSYEIIHGLCHFKLSEKYPRLRPVIHHHIDHHNLGKMNHSNFSVVYPFIDNLFGTRIKRGEDV